MKTPELILAEAIIRAADLRELSYNHAMQLDYTAKNGLELANTLNFNQFYMLTLFQAAEQATQRENPELAYPVYFLLQHTWNDALDWAQSVVLKKPA